MPSDEGYDGDGQFALWLSQLADPEGDEDYERRLRSDNLDVLRAEEERLKPGGRFKSIAIWRWNYQTELDDILVEDYSD